MRKHGKVDGNHADIVKRFKRYLFSVQSAASIGSGCPDLIIARAGKTAMVEVKIKGGKLNPKQRDWFDAWRGKVYVANCIEDVDRIALSW